MIPAGILAGGPAGGSAPYHADAVHFDGSTYLSIANLTAPDSAVVSLSIFFKPTTLSGFLTLFVGDPESDYINYLDIGASSGDGLPFVRLSGDQGGDSMQIQSLSQCNVGAWNSLVVTADTTALIAKMYLNGVDVTSTVDSATPFNSLFNGKPLFIGSDLSGPFTGDMAIFWIAPGVSLLTGSDISPATLALFIDGDNKPANPTGYPNGGVGFFNGNAAAFGTNQGTGGAFTTTGTLTNASSSPSD